ncbi:MAG: T9SS type B sorting domain-containing protein [Bacteroidota bacterium]
MSSFLLLWMALWPTLGTAQVRIPCDSSFFVSFQRNGSSKIVKGVIGQNGPRFTQVLVDLPTRQLGPIGYSVWDGHLYALDVKNLDLVRIDGNGSVFKVQSLAGNLDQDLDYTNGFMSPTGRRFSVMAHDGSQAKDRWTNNIRVDLDARIGQNDIINLEPYYVTAAAYSPFFGVLYGFDDNKPSLVQVGSGLISSYNYPSLGNTSMGALFFDQDNNLFGYGSPNGSSATQFFGINAGSGQAFPLQEGTHSGVADACACPYRITLEKEFNANALTTCDTLEITYRINSSVGFIYQDLNLTDTLPPGLRFRNLVQKPRSSSFELGPDGSILLDIRYLQLGESELTLSFDIDPTFVGTWSTQAQLDSLPWGLGEVILSDDPNSERLGDPSRFEVGSLDLQVDGDSLLCFGEASQLTANLLPAGTEARISWNTGETGSSITASEAGWYVATASQACDTVRDSIWVGRVPNDLFIDLGPNRSIRQGDTLNLNLQYNSDRLDSIVWTSIPPAPLSCLACSAPALAPLQETLLQVEVEDEFGCRQRDEVLIQVDTTRGIWAPNVFTPNGDALNDWFFLKAEGRGSIQSLQVFDRWGRPHFSASQIPFDEPQLGWNGFYRGQPAPTGTYYWSAILVFPDQSRQLRKGMLTLLR